MISACYIVKNEASNLPVTLSNIAKIADEIIVVDTGSTDDSMEIARSYGAEVYTYAWQGDFAAAKNYAIEQAKGDWIIFLDADEYFSAASLASIRTYTEKFLTRSVDALVCRLINIEPGKEEQPLSSMCLCRIFKKCAHLRYQGKIHEQLVSLWGRLNVCMLSDEIIIYHTGYAKAVVVDKFKRNLELLLKEERENGQTPILCRYLADCYYGLGEYERSYQYAQMHIDNWTQSLEPPTTTYAILLDSLRRVEPDIEKIRQAYLTVLEKLPIYPEFYYYYADFTASLQEYHIALQFYLKALDVFFNQKRPVYAEDNFSGYLLQCYMKIGDLYYKMREFEAAVEFYRLTVEREKYNLVLFKKLYRAMYMLENFSIKQRLAILKQIYCVDNEKDMAFIQGALGKCTIGVEYAYFSQWFMPTLQREVFTALAKHQYTAVKELCEEMVLK